MKAKGQKGLLFTGLLLRSEYRLHWRKRIHVHNAMESMQQTYDTMTQQRTGTTRGLLDTQFL
jgi:hypothetical protein